MSTPGARVVLGGVAGMGAGTAIVATASYAYGNSSTPQTAPSLANHVVGWAGGVTTLGIGAILYGRPAILKEWAYAGFTFDASAAFLSHLSVGDPAYVALIPLLFVAVQLASYFLWKRASPSAVTSPAKTTPLWRGPAAQKRA